MPTYEILASNTFIFEGEAVSFVVTTTAVPDITVLYWRTVQVLGAVTADTFTDQAITGTVVVDNNQAFLTRTTAVVPLVLSAQFKIEIMTDSVSGVAVAVSDVVTIDLSENAPTSQAQPFNAMGGISVGGPPSLPLLVVNSSGSAAFRDGIFSGNLEVNGELARFNSLVEVESNFVTLGMVQPATDITALNGGIILKGATDKTLTWTTDGVEAAWTSNQNFNLITGKEYTINNTQVLSSTTLGSGVITSSLTAVATIGTGQWQGTVISSTYGGTGVNNSDRTITVGGNFTHAGSHTLTLTTNANTSVILPGSGTLVGSDDTSTVTNTMLVNDSITVNGTEIKLGSSVTTPDNDTTYTVSVSGITSGASIDLVAGGSGSGTDSIGLIGGTNVTVTRTDADTITITSKDDDTKYSISAETATGGVALRLSGTDTTTDNVRFAAGTNVTVTRTDDSTITVSAIDTTYTAGTGITLTGTSFSIPQAVTTTSAVTFGSMNLGSATAAATGQLRASGDIIAFAASDMALKENIVPISNALDKVKQLTGITYDWTKEFLDRNGGEDPIYLRKKDIGLLAQEVQLVLPEIVARREDGYLAVKYDRVVALLVEAIKDLSAQVEKLNKHGS